MFHRDRIFLISISLLSSLGHAGDKPDQNFTVKVVDPTPQNPPQMPTVEFQNPYATGGDGNGNFSSDVGSNAGGSVLNFLSAVADYIKGPKPDYDQMRRDTKNQKFIECISKSGPHVAAQFYPQETAAYLQKQYEREMAEMIKQAATVVTPAPISTPAPQSTVHVAGFPSNVRHTSQAAAQHFANQQMTAAASTPIASPIPATVGAIPTPAPAISTSAAAPVVSTPRVLSKTSITVEIPARAVASPVITPTPAPVISVPVVVPSPTPAASTPQATSGHANSPSLIAGFGGGKAIGGIQGTTQLQMPTMNQLTLPKSYIKPLPVPPTAPSSGYTGPQVPSSSPSPSSSSYTPAPTPSDSLEWGKVLQDAGEGAAIMVGAMAITYAAYKTGEGLYNGSKWLWKKLAGETEKQVVQQVVPKSVHANLEFHQNAGHCTTPPKGKSKTGCLRAEVQPGDPRTRGLGDIEFPTDATHIFRDEWGHFVHDTPETRNLLRECYKKGTYHGFDRAGNHQFSMTNPKDGTQLWIKMREGGRLSTAGCNEIHLPIQDFRMTFERSDLA